MSRKTKLTAEEFVETWQKAETIEEVAKAADSTTTSVSQRASLYRHKGIPMKYFPRLGGGTTLDVDMLAKLAKDKAPKGAKMVAAKSSRKTAKKKAKKAA